MSDTPKLSNVMKIPGGDAKGQAHGYRYPAFLKKQPGFADRSYGNDAADLLMFKHGSNWVAVWVEDDDQDRRDDPGSPKYYVQKLDVPSSLSVDDAYDQWYGEFSDQKSFEAETDKELSDILTHL